MSNYQDPLENEHINRLQMFFCLIPVLGVFPSLITLYNRQGNREQQATSRLSITLALIWLSTYILLGVGSQASELFTFRLLFINGLLTSGYFLVSFWLMFRLWQRQSVRLPVITRVAEGITRRHLS